MFLSCARGLAAVCWLLDAMAVNNYALRYAVQKLMDYKLIEFIMWSNFAIDLKLCKEDPGDSSSRGMIADEVQDC